MKAVSLVALFNSLGQFSDICPKLLKVFFGVFFKLAGIFLLGDVFKNSEQLTAVKCTLLYLSWDLDDIGKAKIYHASCFMHCCSACGVDSPVILSGSAICDFDPTLMVYNLDENFRSAVPMHPLSSFYEVGGNVIVNGYNVFRR